MKVLYVKDEDFINYKKTSMFIGLPNCSGKCWKEKGLPCTICQNNSLRDSSVIDISVDDLIIRYDSNPLSESVVFGGLEPFDSEEDLNNFIHIFRYNHADTVSDIMFFETREKVIHNKNIDYLYTAGMVKIKIVLCGED